MLQWLLLLASCLLFLTKMNFEQFHATTNQLLRKGMEHFVSLNIAHGHASGIAPYFGRNRHFMTGSFCAKICCFSFSTNFWIYLCLHYLEGNRSAFVLVLLFWIDILPRASFTIECSGLDKCGSVANIYMNECTECVAVSQPKSWFCRKQWNRNRTSKKHLNFGSINGDRLQRGREWCFWTREFVFDWKRIEYEAEKEI